MKRYLYILAFLLPLLSAAEQVVWVENSCCAGKQFTLRIPVRFANIGGECQWYRNDTLIETTPLAAGAAAVEYTIPGVHTHGDSVKFHFKYRLNDGYTAWTMGRTYMVSFPYDPPQASEIQGDTVVCAGSTATYSVDGELGVTYHWELPNGWTPTAGGTTNRITVRVGTNGGTVSVTPTNDCGIGNTRTREVTVNALPTVAGVTDSSRCGTGTVLLTATASASATIDWYSASTGGTALSSGATSYTTPSILATTIYYAQARNAATGCVSSARTPVTATINAVPAAVTVAGTTPACTSTTLTASGGSGGTVYWQNTTADGTSTATASGSQAVTESGTYYFRARSAAGCWGAQGSHAVTVNAPSTLTLTSGNTAQTVCQNTANFTSIVYTYGGSATNASVSGLPAGVTYAVNTANKRVTISGMPTGYSSSPFTYTVTTTGHSSPCTAATATGTITVIQASTLTLTGGTNSQTVCQYTPITSIIYTRGGSAANTTISWSPSAPAGITSSTSGTTRTISGASSSYGTFTYTVSTTGHASPCTAVSLSGTITLTGIGSSGDTFAPYFCEGGITSAGNISFTATPPCSGVTSEGTVSFAPIPACSGVTSAGSITFAPDS